VNALDFGGVGRGRVIVVVMVDVVGVGWSLPPDEHAPTSVTASSTGTSTDIRRTASEPTDGASESHPEDLTLPLRQLLA
jgi:hypothetical protein